jgi:methionine-gamma-lyase
MKKHSENAKYLAENIQSLGIKVFYPGLKTSRNHDLINEIMNEGFGYGGMLTIDVVTYDNAKKLMTAMQEEKIGYLAVSLGYFKTLFSSPGHSTSSEIPEDERKSTGLSDGLIRFSVGLDNNIEEIFNRIKKCMKSLKII